MSSRYVLEQIGCDTNTEINSWYSLLQLVCSSRKVIKSYNQIILFRHYCHFIYLIESIYLKASIFEGCTKPKLSRLFKNNASENLRKEKNVRRIVYCIILKEKKKKKDIKSRQQKKNKKNI